MCRKLFSRIPHVVSPLDLMRPGTLQASFIKLCCKKTSTLEQGLVILSLEILLCYVKHSASACMHFHRTLWFYCISIMYHCVLYYLHCLRVSKGCRRGYKKCFDVFGSFLDLS